MVRNELRCKSKWQCRHIFQVNLSRIRPVVDQLLACRTSADPPDRAMDLFFKPPPHESTDN